MDCEHETMTGPELMQQATKVRLRDVESGDLPIFFAHQSDADACKMAAFPGRDWNAFTLHWNRMLEDPKVRIQTVLVDDQVAGNVGSWESEWRRLVCYWIGKEWWGRGVASAALAALLEQDSVRPMYAHVAKHNQASIRVLEKCGFKLCFGFTESPPMGDDGVEELVFRLCPP
jgi:RimJ/RimL family protein N-acetyltransferase